MARTPRYTKSKIEETLIAVSGNVSAAARSLGMQRHGLHKIISKSEQLFAQSFVVATTAARRGAGDVCRS